MLLAHHVALEYSPMQMCEQLPPVFFQLIVAT